MILTQLTLTDMRNYAALDLQPAPGVNAFLGSNAQGKSNLLEAIAMLGIGKSFRTSREAEIIRRECSQAVISGEARIIGGVVRLSCGVTVGARAVRKEYRVNGEPVRHTAFLGRACVVTFTPADLQLISGPPALRRSLLDTALSQASPTYYHALVGYARAVTQKNALLRQESAIDETLLDTYDEHLIRTGSLLMAERASYIAEIAQAAAAAATRIDQGEHGFLQVSYHPNVSLPTTHEEIPAAFAERMREGKKLERLRGQALVGPHRDDLRVTLDGFSLASFGSQGQRRTAVLALKIAEYDSMRARIGEAPLLLLDDVLSELDARRRQGFLERLGAAEQVFLTGTADMPISSAATKYEVCAGAVVRMA